jgi:hypothetical protein
MSLYRETFPKKNTLLTVVHAMNTQQAIQNAKISYENGADGIFLINHRVTHKVLIDIFYEVKHNFPHLWIGINCLDLERKALGVVPKSCKGLWVDNAGINELHENPTELAEEFARDRKASCWEGIYFGGVAFKYQPPVGDVADVARLAMPYVDVITTSGEATGIVADVSKILKMRQAIGDHPLAMASGITVDNVSKYTDLVDCFLVATGISDSHTELNPSKVNRLATILNK